MAKNAIEKTKLRIRQKVKGTAERPRLSVFRSNNHIYAQLIDDVKGQTLVSSSSVDKSIANSLQSGSTCDASILVGQTVAKKCLEHKITHVVFDRGGRIYHGRIKALADAARQEGLNF
jgi:large subunit ribosomal protein L18